MLRGGVRMTFGRADQQDDCLPPGQAYGVFARGRHIKRGIRHFVVLLRAAPPWREGHVYLHGGRRTGWTERHEHRQAKRRDPAF